ncbi:MAG: glycosyl hydrolase family 18 protein [Shewanella sp.]|nr:glycosyl hydrolase family 18 protein [Shewanella sp.]
MRHIFTYSVLAASCAMALQAQAVMDCSGIPKWDKSIAYTGGAVVKNDNLVFKANWWTQGNNPASHSGDYMEWSRIDICSDGGPTDPELPNKAPSVSFAAPANGSEYTVGEQVAIGVNASDEDGEVAKVVVSVAGKPIDELTKPPFTSSWTAIEGQHQIQVVATDEDGGTASAASTISVKSGATEPENQLPTVSLNLSTNNVKQGETVTLSADAKDSDGSINKVEFFVSGRVVATVNSAPFSTEWLAADTGKVSVFARAYDNEGARTDSAKLAMTVTGDEVLPPPTVDCRPEGLYQTPGVAVPYCSTYDEEGRERLGADHQRRVIGYFTSWRTGDNPATNQYLVNDIPWDKLTHINYAFVSIGSDGRVNIGDVNDPDNVAVGREWDGVDIDPELGFKGHFGALATYKKRYGVKTLFAIGGWAETGGHFDNDGNRVADGGFYTMTTNADGSINHAGIEKFADSAVEMMRQYQFDGIDIDYEYPSSMAGAGNPMDSEFSEARRPYLMRSYNELLRVLREKLDIAAQEDGQHYLLSIASPSSAYLLRGMENFESLKYLDYVNIMSYDLHGSWNEYVGHNAALYDTGEDAELAQWGVYSTEQYKGTGYLNTDWAYHYMRGALQSGRINIGVPYYSRGWQGVTGGDHGLWGRAPLPNQSECPAGTGGTGGKCGDGAMGINNLWHDLDASGNEIGAGVNPMWHAMNLEIGRQGSYTYTNGMDPENNPAHQLKGTYTRHYDDVAVAPWLWNEEQKVFLSTEDKQSIARKADYVVEQGIGGVLIWELAGDYACYQLDANGKRGAVDTTEQACQSGKGEYYMGDTLSTTLYEAFKAADPYGNHRSETGVPEQAVNISVSVGGYKEGDQNYPINPKITFTNNTGVELPGGTEFRFDIPSSTPDNAMDWSGAKLTVIDSAHSRGDNIGGLDGKLHKVSFSLPKWSGIPAGGSYELDMVHYLPISGPANYTVMVNGVEYAFAFEYPNLPLADLDTPTDPEGPNPGPNLDPEDCDTSGVNVYPNWPQLDWAGKPDHATGGDKMLHDGIIYQANWWTQSEPGSDASWSKLCSVN